MSWFRGTCTATSGSPTVSAMTGGVLDNAIEGQGILIQGSETLFEVLDIDDNATITLGSNFDGTTGTVLAFAMVPIRGYDKDIATDLADLVANMGAWVNLDLAEGDIAQLKGGVLAARSPTQFMQDATGGSLAPAIVNVAASGTCDIGNVTSTRVAITGSTTISSFGTLQNCVREGIFTGSLTLQNGANMVLNNGGSNIAINAGDRFRAWSDGSSPPIWYVNVQPLDGQQVSATANVTQALIGQNSSSLMIGPVSSSAVQIASTSTTASLAILRAVAGTSGPMVTLAKTRSATLGAFAAVQVNDVLGDLNYVGDDGTTYATISARIRAHATGTISTGVVPGVLTLQTANASGVLGTALTLDSSLNATFGGLAFGTAANNLTAHAGGGQSSALALTASVNAVTTVASAADSVQLPVSVAGSEITIINAGASAMQVYGAGTDTINGVATGTGVSVPAGKTAFYSCSVAGKWYGGYLN